MTDIVYLVAVSRIEDLRRHAAVAQLACQARVPVARPREVRTTRLEQTGGAAT